MTKLKRLLLFGLLAISCVRALAQAGQQPSQPGSIQPEEAPQKKKEDTSNPAQAAEKTKEVGLEAVQVTRKATQKAGMMALIRARDWESGWLTGAYVGKDQPIVPLSGRERGEYYLRQTLTTPSAYMKRMFAAGIDQARGAPSQWDDGWGGYAERFASREGQFISANSLAALGNAALRYEPRYDQCKCSGFWPRTRHAIMRNFLTYDHDGALRPQWGLYGGAFGGGVISTAWKPHPRNAFAQGGWAMLGQAGYGVALNFYIEIYGEINRKIGAKAR